MKLTTHLKIKTEYRVARSVFDYFLPEVSNSHDLNLVGLLTLLIFDFLPIPIAIGTVVCSSKIFSCYDQQAGLQLRGQFRSSTGFPVMLSHQICERQR